MRRLVLRGSLLRPLLALTVPVVLLSLAIATAPAAFADHTTVPNVVGRDVDRAVGAIERAGLEPVVVEIADAQEGRVVAQEPAGGTAIERGSSVEIRVGVMIRIETRVPTVVGWEAERAQQALSGAYVVEIEEVRVASGQEGTVIETVPAAGQRLQYRGTLVLRVAVVPQRVQVPALQGLSYEDAERLLIGIGLVASPSFAAVWGAPAWSVISQNPPAGTLVEIGSDVQIVVAQPRQRFETVRVPNLFGMTEHDAARVLQSMGLTSEVERIPSRFPDGRVVRQDPAAGASVRLGTPIRLTVAIRGGPIGIRRRALVPNLVGMDLSAARMALAQAGFQAQLELVEAPGQPIDQVLEQEPAAGTPAPPGARIRIRATAGIVVPDLIGKRQAEANAILVAAGLRAAFDSMAIDPRAVVAAQDPQAGRQVARGTVVRLTMAVNPGMRRIPVPNLVGLGINEAQSALAALGLTATVEGPPGPPGLLAVIAQDPPAGTQVQRGAAIVLRVARRR